LLPLSPGPRAAELPTTLLGPRVRRVFHTLLLALLVWALAVQAARVLVDGVVLLVAAAAVAIAAAALYRRFRAVQLWLAFAAVAPIVFLALFLLASPTARLFGGEPVLALEQGVESPAPVVMIVLDELPLASIVDADGAVDRALFPNLADLADDAHWFRNTTTVAGFTWFALPAIVTGNMPADGTSPFAADHPQNLFTLLAGGYDLNVVESLSRLCPENLCETTAGPGDGLGGLLDDVEDVLRARLSASGPDGATLEGFVEPVADDADDGLRDMAVPGSQRVDSLIDGIVDDSLALHFLHLLLPHQPFRHLPSGRTYEGSPHVGWTHDQWREHPWPATLGRQRHLLQAHYTDGLVGQVLDALRERGVYDDALVVLTADHGIAFRPGGPIRLTQRQPLEVEDASQLLWVPLFVKLPGQTEPEVSDANVLTVDVLPTIADVLDIDLPEPVDGRSVFGPERSGSAKPFRYSHEMSGSFELDEEVTVDGAVGFDGMLDVSVGRFAPGPGGVGRLWRVGPAPELLGTSAEDLPEVETLNLDPTIEVAADDTTVPALLVNAVSAEEGDRLAVAVNGVIASTTVAFQEENWVLMATLLDERRFEVGTNEITVHRIPDPQN
jgi:hypothetical protein